MLARLCVANNYVCGADSVRVEAYNEQGVRVDFKLEGFPAVVIQHECDHLDGVLYVDRIQDMTKFAFEQEADRFLDQDFDDDDEDEDDDD